jgi:hypothetical protein
MTKVNRNDPCTCGSGKKFKKCCVLKEGLAKYKTTKLDSSKASSLMAKKISGLSGHLQNKLS